MPNLSLPPISRLDNDVQAAFRAIDTWARSLQNEVQSIRVNSDQLTKVTREVTNVVNKTVAQNSYVKPVQPSNPINDDRIVRSIISNSGMAQPITMNSPVVFVAGDSSTGVGIGAGGIIGKNAAYANASYDGYTFGISAEDGSFFFGAEDWGAGVMDHARKQIIFDVATNTLQFGSEIVIKKSDGSTKTLEEITEAATGYTTADLQADLAAGVGTVLAGQGSSYRMLVDTSTAKIIMGHQNCVPGGTVAVGSRGTGQSAIAITSSGIAMGYNHPTTGVWANAVAIDASGNASFSGAINATSGNFTGTVNAGSFIAGSVTVNGSAGNTTLDTIISGAYSKTKLESDLSAGIGKILAGSGADYVLNVDSATAKVVIGHKNCIPGGTVAVGSRGNGQSAIAITSGGIAMGYNHPTTGVWANAIAIDATGNASFSGAINATSGNFTGTVTAASIISGSATVDGQTLSTIKSNASLGASAYSSLSAKLEASSSYILSGVMSVTAFGGGIRTGNVAWDANGTVNAGSGIAITNKGIVGVSNNVVTFSVNGTTGAAVFKGDISGATGTFSGSISTSGQVFATGTTSSALGVDAAIVGFSSSASAGVVGKGTSYGVYGNSTYGVYGQGTQYGVYGDGNSYGVYGYGASYGVYAESISGTALYVKGRMNITDSTLVSNLNADRLDGYHADSFPRYVGPLTSSGATLGGKAVYWAVFNVGGTNYNFLVSAYP